MASNKIPRAALEIIEDLSPPVGQVNWEIRHYPDGRVVATLFFRPFSAIPQISTTPRTLRRRKRKSPSQLRRSRLRLEAFLARKDCTQRPQVAIDIPPLNSPVNDVIRNPDEPATQGDGSVNVDATVQSTPEAVGCLDSVECGLVYTNIDIVCESVKDNIAVPVDANIVCELDVELPVHTVPSLVDVLPTSTPREVEELATSFYQDLIDGLREQKVILGILDVLRAKRSPLPADVDRYHKLEERAFIKTQNLDFIQRQHDLVMYWVKHHTKHY
jgi:hypothetical protein